MLEATSARFNQAVYMDGSSNHQWMHHSVTVLSVLMVGCLIHNIWKKKHSQAFGNVCGLGVLQVVSYNIDVRNLEDIMIDFQEEKQKLELQVSELSRKNTELKREITPLREQADTLLKTETDLREEIVTLQATMNQQEIQIESFKKRVGEFGGEIDHVEDTSKKLIDNTKIFQDQMQALQEKVEDTNKKFQDQMQALQEKEANVRQSIEQLVSGNKKLLEDNKLFNARKEQFEKEKAVFVQEREALSVRKLNLEERERKLR